MSEKMLVLADVDNTTIVGGNMPSPRTLRVLHMFRRAGGILVPDTSRTEELMQRANIRRLRFKDGMVLDGGATLIAPRRLGGQRHESSRWISAETTRSVIRVMQDLDCQRVHYGGDSIGSSPHEIDLEDVVKDSPSVFGVFPDESEPAVREALAAVPGITAHYNSFHKNLGLTCVQTVSRGVHKGVGAELIRQTFYADVASERIMAIGDGRPDVDLLKAVPEGARRVAMGDGPAQLLEVATHTTLPASEDGFALAVEEFMQSL